MPQFMELIAVRVLRPCYEMMFSKTSIVFGWVVEPIHGRIAGMERASAQLRIHLGVKGFFSKFRRVTHELVGHCQCLVPVLYKSYGIVKFVNPARGYLHREFSGLKIRPRSFMLTLDFAPFLQAGLVKALPGEIGGPGGILDADFNHASICFVRDLNIDSTAKRISYLYFPAVYVVQGSASVKTFHPGFVT